MYHTYFCDFWQQSGAVTKAIYGKQQEITSLCIKAYSIHYSCIRCGWYTWKMFNSLYPVNIFFQNFFFFSSNQLWNLSHLNPNSESSLTCTIFVLVKWDSFERPYTQHVGAVGTRNVFIPLSLSNERSSLNMEQGAPAWRLPNTKLCCGVSVSE